MKDAWGRTIEYVRLSLTDACNFCCPYCRPAEITPQSQHQLLSVDEWMTILGAFHQVGVKAVRLTGGEPLLYPHIEELLARIKQTGWFEDISMTTNGSPHCVIQPGQDTFLPSQYWVNRGCFLPTLLT